MSLGVGCFHSLLTRGSDNVSMMMLDLTFSVSMTIMEGFFDVDWLEDVALENDQQKNKMNTKSFFTKHVSTITFHCENKTKGEKMQHANAFCGKQVH